MLNYPKIPGSRHAPSGRCVAFEKYDGTNLHWGWDPEFGWITFGTRRDTFDLYGRGLGEFVTAHPELDGVADLFLREYASSLEKIFRSHAVYRSLPMTAFTEYVGPNSFAGRHRRGDPMELVLFDVRVGDAMLGPEQFLKDFQGLSLARVVYRGKLSGQFAEDVRNGKYGVTEGVVCKGGSGPDLWMVKIKTYAYLQKLKEAFAANWEDFWE